MREAAAGPHAVLRFVLDAGDGATVVAAPRSAKPVLVAHQPGRMQEHQVGLWLEVPVHPDGALCSPVERFFEIRGTGQIIPGRRQHIGSAVAGRFVWHVFEVQTA